jgi:UDP-N-acetylglucosamine 3-dehydrogenase
MIAVTVIGSGFMGQNHARAVADHPSLALDSVVDIDAERASALAETFGADASLTEYEAALDRADAAVIATPESVHADQANAALDRGVHLLLEKPITESLEKARALADRTGDVGVVTGVSFILRYDPGYARARQAAADGDLGDLIAARVKRGITIEESRRIGARGHPLYYMSVHDIDALLWCVDSTVKEVRAIEHRGELSDVGVPDATQALLSFADGPIATIEGYGTLPNDTPGGIEAAFELVGSQGTATVETPGNVLSVTSESGYDRPDVRHWPVVNQEMGGAVANQIDRFAKAINGSHEMLASVRDGYRAQRIATAIEEAIDTGDTVALDAIDQG